jgi:hypothetical protein
MRIKNFLLSIMLMCSFSLSSVAQTASVKRVILFIIDGLSTEAPSRLNMPFF